MDPGDKHRDDRQIWIAGGRNMSRARTMYDDLPIVDAHHHLWDLEGPIAYPWLKEATSQHDYMGDNSALRRSYLPGEYRRDTALHNVVATVHVEAECDRSQQVAETRWLTLMHARHGMPNVIVAHG